DEKFKIFKHMTGIKTYEPATNVFDLYERDKYKFEIYSITGFSVLKDFLEAQYAFTEAYNILKYIGRWDKSITKQKLYQELTDNVYRSLIYCCVYVNNYEKALKYLKEYEKITSDKKFILDWKTRIYGVLVKIAEKYDWSFTGDKSYRKRKEQHRKILLEAIEFYYPEDTELKHKLIEKIYPEFIYKPVKKTNK
ncbi:MAG: hypothetical protein ACTSQJ_19285, partial [Promethearchaeota archaeon]